jgi:hypothetical protein
VTVRFDEIALVTTTGSADRSAQTAYALSAHDRGDANGRSCAVTVTELSVRSGTMLLRITSPPPSTTRPPGERSLVSPGHSAIAVFVGSTFGPTVATSRTGALRSADAIGAPNSTADGTAKAVATAPPMMSRLKLNRPIPGLTFDWVSVWSG